MHPVFEMEVLKMDKEVQKRLLARAKILGDFGPKLGRPHVDTLVGSVHSNMKELRFRTRGGVWRVAFAFDPKRQAVLLVAGDKSSVNQKVFYKKLIQIADKRFADWIEN